MYRKIRYLLNSLFCWEFCCKEINFGFVHVVIIPKLTLSSVIIFIAVIFWKESILTPQKYPLPPPPPLLCSSLFAMTGPVDIDRFYIYRTISYE